MLRRRTKFHPNFQLNMVHWALSQFLQLSFPGPAKRAQRSETCLICRAHSAKPQVPGWLSQDGQDPYNTVCSRREQERATKGSKDRQSLCIEVTQTATACPSLFLLSEHCLSTRPGTPSSLPCSSDAASAALLEEHLQTCTALLGALQSAYSFS